MAAIAIASLLLASLDAAFRCLWAPIFRLGAFLLLAIAIRDVPYISPTLTTAARFMMISSLYFLYGAMAGLLAAWLLSRWVYGKGPIRSLMATRDALMESKHV